MRGMKTLTLLLSLFFLASVARGQEVVNPVRVALILPDEKPLRVDLTNKVGDELRALGYVEFVSPKRADWRVTLAVAEDKRSGGYDVGLLVVGRNDDGQMSLHDGDSLGALAKYLAEKLEREFFTKRRAERLPDAPPTRWARPAPKK